MCLGNIKYKKNTIMLVYMLSEITKYIKSLTIHTTCIIILSNRPYNWNEISMHYETTVLLFKTENGYVWNIPYNILNLVLNVTNLYFYLMPYKNVY